MKHARRGSKACEGRLNGSHWLRLRADERINRALADAVERHAAKDPGVSGILKRTSATCHPESESQKKIAVDTEQDRHHAPRSRTEDHQHQA